MSSGHRSSDGSGAPAPAGLSDADAERWARVKAVFLDALEHPDAERDGFIAQACGGDAALRREVESLLASDGQAGSFAEMPAAALLGSASSSDAEHRPRLPAGTRLGSYEILEFVAAGGMGEVYRARHTVLGRQVAIKTVSGRLGNASANRRLVREARNASSLSHPNICTIYEVGEAAGAPFIVMEYLEGNPLHEIVRSCTPAREETLTLGIQIATALAHAHQHGIVHRDLKSSNVVVDAVGNAKVLDFGLSRRLMVGGVAREETTTADHMLAGTLSHMAPELLRGERGDARSDIWALGVVLYELTSGELPFTRRTRFETSSAILGDSPKAMSTKVPLALRLVMERCLAKNPAGRYQRAQDVLDELRSIQQRRGWPAMGHFLIAARRRTLHWIGAAVEIRRNPLFQRLLARAGLR